MRLGRDIQWDISLKVSIELSATSRHHRDMTERLLKAMQSPYKTNKQTDNKNKHLYVCTKNRKRFSKARLLHVFWSVSLKDDVIIEENVNNAECLKIVSVQQFK